MEILIIILVYDKWYNFYRFDNCFKIVNVIIFVLILEDEMIIEYFLNDLV